MSNDELKKYLIQYCEEHNLEEALECINSRDDFGQCIGLGGEDLLSLYVCLTNSTSDDVKENYIKALLCSQLILEEEDKVYPKYDVTEDKKKIFASHTVNLDPLTTEILGDYFHDYFGDNLNYIAKIIRAFNEKPSDRRVFNEIHCYASGDTNLTIGFGHFAAETIITFFKEMRPKVWTVMRDYMARRITLNSTYFSQFCEDYVIEKYKDKNKKSNANFVINQTKTDVEKALDYFFCKDLDPNNNKEYIQNPTERVSRYKLNGKKYQISEKKKEYLSLWADTIILKGKEYDIKTDQPKAIKKPKFKQYINGVKQEGTVTRTNYFLGLDPQYKRPIGYWFTDVLMGALLLKEVCYWQVILWLNHILDTSGKTTGDVASGTSWKSTGGSGKRDVYQTYKLACRKSHDDTNKKSENIKLPADNATMRSMAYWNSYNFNRIKSGRIKILDKAIYENNILKRTGSGEYNEKNKKYEKEESLSIRGRMNSIWDLFYKDYFGGISAPLPYYDKDRFDVPQNTKDMPSSDIITNGELPDMLNYLEQFVS